MLTAKARVLKKTEFSHFSLAQSSEILQQVFDEADGLVIANILSFLPEEIRKQMRISCRKLRRAVDFDKNHARSRLNFGGDARVYHQMTNFIYALGFVKPGDHGMDNEEWERCRIGKERSVPFVRCVKMRSISCSCTWKDQGWGNQKSELFLLLLLLLLKELGLIVGEKLSP